MVCGRKVWKIPVMDGDFIIEDGFGIVLGVAGGNFLILSQDNLSGLKAAEQAIKAIKEKVSGVIMPFPGGICRSGSKVGSLKYKLQASTNHVFCPTLKEILADSKLSKDVNCVYEIVINGLTFEAVKKAIYIGISAASQVSGVLQISAGNYGGKLGQYKVYLRDLLNVSS
jgi:formylmethanofuran--tetrahydromethanopterin N-formyltransferase